MRLIDCGKASKQTKGHISGVFFEGSAAPFAWYNRP